MTAVSGKRRGARRRLTEAEVREKLKELHQQARTLVLPRKCVEASREHRGAAGQDRLTAGPLWQDHGLVFVSAVGTPMDDHTVRRMFRAITEDAGPGTGSRGWVS
jgi:hypothetical protein